jgi:eukaryotic-like serine/threonine-protein kinase
VDTTLSDPLVGRVVDGRYRVESRVARGGMATVYLALDRRLDREVALKVMLPQLADDAEFVGRFVREARAAARLSHPNVVQVFDQGSDGDLLYLAMEYLPGRTLRDVLAERRAFTVREALTVLDPVLDALGAAHRAGIVHRDVKPENVILTDDGRVKVADFGLARAMSTAAATTSSGVILGTAAYLAPEVVARGIADARADVYSAGILLFEMLTGRQPFPGPDVAAVARRHVTDIVPRPSALVPHLLPAMDALVEAATRSDPDARPANAEQLLALVRDTRQELPEAALDIRPQVPIYDGGDGHTEVVPMAVSNLRVVNRSEHQPTMAMPMMPGGGSLVQSLGPVPTDPRLMPPESMDHLRPPPLHPPPQAVMQRRRRRGRIGLLVLLILVALLGSVAWWFTGGPGAYTRTPPTVGQTLQQAVSTLHSAGLGVDQQPAYDDTIKAGVVISSDPAGGGKVRKGGTVTLVVSRGAQTFPVPTLIGKTQNDAAALIGKASLKLGEVTKKYDNTIAAGVVMSSSPKAGTALTRGQPVDLVVSKGARPVQVPDFTGQQQDQAIGALDQLNLKHKVIMSDNTSVPAGQVLTQDPGAGSTAHSGDTVTLVVSKGPPLVTVPDVKDKKFDEAQQTLQQAGFQVQRTGTDFLGRVVNQSPAAGQQAPQGSIVVVTTF